MDRPKLNRLLKELVDAFDETPERFQLSIPGKEMRRYVDEALGYPDIETFPTHVKGLLQHLEMDWSDEPDALYCPAELWSYVHVIQVVWARGPLT